MVYGYLRESENQSAAGQVRAIQEYGVEDSCIRKKIIERKPSGLCGVDYIGWVAFLFQDSSASPGRKSIRLQ